MASNMTARRDKAASSALSFFETFEAEIGAGIDQRLLPYWEPDEDPIDFRRALRAVGRLMAASLDEVLATDRENSYQLDEATVSRAKVWEASHEVHSKVVFIRQLLGSLYGTDEADEKVDFDGPTAAVAQPKLLVSQGKHLLGLLRRLLKRKGSGGVKGCRVNHGVLTDELLPGLARLVGANKVLERVRRRAEASTAAKTAAGKSFDGDFRDGVRLFKALCRLAGRPDLAGRIKASF